MTDETDFQEKTHEATPAKKQKAQEQGTVLRSKELNSAILLLSTAVMLFILGNRLLDCFGNIMKKAFTLKISVDEQNHVMMEFLWESFKALALTISPLFITVLLLLIISPALLGGFHFNFTTLAPKFDRLNPLKGLKKIVSPKNLIEIVKIVLKFSLIIAVGVYFLISQLEHILSLGSYASESAIKVGFKTLGLGFMFLIMPLIVIAGIDLPVQIREYNQKLKMSTQEIRDESKETDGNPENKKRLRRAQQELAKKRMLHEVKNASVVLMNPEHYAVALRYEHKKSRAPIVVAKGTDFMALKIKALAKKHRIEIIESPKLTRAIYFNTELFREIPDGLYGAVAQVLAYIYQLNRYKNVGGTKPIQPNELIIPDYLRTEERI